MATKRKVLFLRHSETNPKNSALKGMAADVVRDLSPKGVALAEATAAALADEGFGLVITSGVMRTNQTGAIVSAPHSKTLKDAVSRRTLYMPMDETKADQLFAIFDEAKTARKSYERPELSDQYMPGASMIMNDVAAYGAEKTLVVNHMCLIQILIAVIGRGKFDDVLDVELGPCDGIWVVVDEDSLMLGYEIFRAPKVEG